MSKRGQALRIAIADDEAPARSRIRDLLEDCAASFALEVVGEAANGRTLIELLQRTPADVVLLDIRMPELDGIEATRQIRQRRSHARTPIFAISAYATHDVKDDALAAGCTEVFAKPLDLASLLGKIESSLAQQASSQPIYRTAAGSR